MLQGLTGAAGVAGGYGLASAALARGEGSASAPEDAASEDAASASAALPVRIPAFATLAGAGEAVRAGELEAEAIVDVLGHARAGDGGGFRGIVLARADDRLPGEGLIEPLDSLLDVRLFGPCDTPAQATRTVQLALDWSAARQHVVHLTRRFDIVEPLVIGRNAGLVGMGAGFGCGFRPLDCPALAIDGERVDGGFVFNVLLRDFVIWGDQVTSPQSHAISLSNCYRSGFENITLRGYAIGREGTEAVLSISGKQNQVVFDRLNVAGKSVGAGGCGVRIANSPDAGHVHFSNVDVEKAETGVILEPGARAQFSNPYFERLDTAILIQPGVRSIVVDGGIVRLGKRRAVGVRLADGEYNRNEHIALTSLAFQTGLADARYVGIGGENVIWENRERLSLVGVDLGEVAVSPAIRRAAGLV